MHDYFDLAWTPRNQMRLVFANLGAPWQDLRIELCMEPLQVSNENEESRDNTRATTQVRLF